jgi:serine/threonine protein kinase
VHHLLANGGHENVYVEIGVSQAIGNDIHVLRIIEVLQIGRFLCIVMPRCEASVCDFISNPQEHPLDDNGRRMLYRQMLEALDYIHSRGICHRDISPGNFLVLNGRVLLADFAMCLFTNGGLLPGSRARYGTLPFQAPEVLAPSLPMFENDPLVYFHPRQADEYGVHAIFAILNIGFNFWYRLPSPDEFRYRFLIMARALSSSPVEGLIHELVHEIEVTSARQIWNATLRYAQVHSRAQEARDTLTMYETPMAMDPYLWSSLVAQIVATNDERLRRMNRALILQLEMSMERCRELNQLRQRIFDLDDSLLELMGNTLNPNPQERWSAEDALNSPWMQQQQHP